RPLHGGAVRGPAGRHSGRAARCRDGAVDARRPPRRRASPRADLGGRGPPRLGADQRPPRLPGALDGQRRARGPRRRDGPAGPGLGQGPRRGAQPAPLGPVRGRPPDGGPGRRRDRAGRRLRSGGGGPRRAAAVAAPARPGRRLRPAPARGRGDSGGAGPRRDPAGGGAPGGGRGGPRPGPAPPAAGWSGPPPRADDGGAAHPGPGPRAGRGGPAHMGGVTTRYACLWVPHFAAAALTRTDPALRGRPVAALAGTETTRTVSEPSPEAWAAGVRPGMSAGEAVTRAPGLVGRLRDPHAER